MGSDANNLRNPASVPLTWTLGSGAFGVNEYALFSKIDSATFGWPVSKANAPLQSGINVVPPIGPGEAHELRFTINMPLQRSDGAGEQFGMSVTLMAAVA